MSPFINSPVDTGTKLIILTAAIGRIVPVGVLGLLLAIVLASAAGMPHLSGAPTGIVTQAGSDIDWP